MNFDTVPSLCVAVASAGLFGGCGTSPPSTYPLTYDTVPSLHVFLPASAPIASASASLFGIHGTGLIGGPLVGLSFFGFSQLGGLLNKHYVLGAGPLGGLWASSPRGCRIRPSDLTVGGYSNAELARH